MRHEMENLFATLKDWRHGNRLRPLCPYFLLCRPPRRHCHLLLMSPEPRNAAGPIAPGSQGWPPLINGGSEFGSAALRYQWVKVPQN